MRRSVQSLLRERMVMKEMNTSSWMQFLLYVYNNKMVFVMFICFNVVAGACMCFCTDLVVSMFILL